MPWISVKNLPKYQHYKHRNPPWVKLYREAWTDYTLRACSVSERLLFLGLTTLGMELNNQIPHDPKYLTGRLGFAITNAMLAHLISFNLLSSNLEEHVASAVLADCTHDASVKVVDPRAGRDYRTEAKAVLAFLNEKTGKAFREVEANLTPIEARLASGIDLQLCKTLIARKVRDWMPDEKMKKYLRPETLFNKTKFETYLAEVTT